MYMSYTMTDYLVRVLCIIIAHTSLRTEKFRTVLLYMLCGLFYPTDRANYEYNDIVTPPQSLSLSLSIFPFFLCLQKNGIYLIEMSSARNAQRPNPSVCGYCGVAVVVVLVESVWGSAGSCWFFSWCGFCCFAIVELYFPLFRKNCDIRFMPAVFEGGRK